MKKDTVAIDDIKNALEKDNNQEIVKKILPKIIEEKNGNIEFSENEVKICQGINLFNEKLNKAYKIRYGDENLKIRDYIATNEDILLLFFVAYKFSKYYKEDTEEDKKINYNVFEQLKNIIFEIYMIFEFEIFDDNGLYKEKPENEYELIYNLNKTQNLILKTRIVWEKVMNFFYLLIERKELKEKGSKKSKKKAFEDWRKEKGIFFFDDALKKLKIFDEKLRTSEIHSFSKLKNYFERGINQNISLYCLDLIFTFSNETIINIMAYINDIPPKYKMWQKLPKDISEQLSAFIDAPEWVKEYTKNENIYDIIDDGTIINNYEEVKKEMFNKGTNDTDINE